VHPGASRGHEASSIHRSNAVPAHRIRTDSKYVVESYNRALYEWQSNKWMTRDGNPVANAPQMGGTHQTHLPRWKTGRDPLG
jgi:hypothetical protein